jgi:beta-aspartyl-peptidase (threonine type)
LSAGYTLAIHGGAGALPKGAYAAEVRAGLCESLAVGEASLASGAPALEAVLAAVRVLEATPCFNAGTGSVLNASGEVEMDAALMEGTDRRAGAVAGVRRVAHPIEAAREVLRDGRHVLLCGEGADAFARAAGVGSADPAALITDFRRSQLARVADVGERAPGGGTVGAVARDAAGHLAVATSTGGLVAKRPGRVSDSALIGCGTWADDATCAVSATGEGEYFIRSVFAHAVAARMRHGAGLDAACHEMLVQVASLGGSGGCIAVSAAGDVALPFDTPAMSRGLVRRGGPALVALGPGDPSPV